MQPSDPSHDPDDVREAARRILDDSVFEPDSNPIAWLAAQRGFSALLLVAAVAALFVLILWLVRRYIRKENVDDFRGPVVVLGEDIDPVQIESELAAAITRRDYSAEVVARYRVIIVDLVQRGVLGEEVSRTTGEYVAELRSVRPQDGPVFSAATSVFEDVYYGDTVVGADEARVVEQAQVTLTISTGSKTMRTGARLSLIHI